MHAVFFLVGIKCNETVSDCDQWSLDFNRLPVIQGVPGGMCQTLGECSLC